jgi:hypothetical protein
MFNISDYKATPLGSILTRGQEEQEKLLEASFSVPKNIKTILTSAKTASFIHGLAKNFRLSEKVSPIIAFAILQITLAEKTIAQLPSMLSTELKLPNDQAQKMAKEIEEDLFAPVIQELEVFWTKQKEEEPAQKATERANQGGAKNVLNLKEAQRPPTPPWREEN